MITVASHAHLDKYGRILQENAVVHLDHTGTDLVVSVALEEDNGIQLLIVVHVLEENIGMDSNVLLVKVVHIGMEINA